MNAATFSVIVTQLFRSIQSNFHQKRTDYKITSQLRTRYQTVDILSDYSGKETYFPVFCIILSVVNSHSFGVIKGVYSISTVRGFFRQKPDFQMKLPQQFLGGNASCDKQSEWKKLLKIMCEISNALLRCTVKSFLPRGNDYRKKHFNMNLKEMGHGSSAVSSFR